MRRFSWGRAALIAGGLLILFLLGTLIFMKASSPNRMDKIEQIIDYIAHCPYETLGAPGEYML